MRFLPIGRNAVSSPTSAPASASSHGGIRRSASSSTSPTAAFSVIGMWRGATRSVPISQGFASGCGRLDGRRRSPLAGGSWRHQACAVGSARQQDRSRRLGDEELRSISASDPHRSSRGRRGLFRLRISHRVRCGLVECSTSRPGDAPLPPTSSGSSVARVCERHGVPLKPPSARSLAAIPISTASITIGACSARA